MSRESQALELVGEVLVELTKVPGMIGRGELTPARTVLWEAHGKIGTARRLLDQDVEIGRILRVAAEQEAIRRRLGRPSA